MQGRAFTDDTAGVIIAAPLPAIWASVYWLLLSEIKDVLWPRVTLPLTDPTSPSEALNPHKQSLEAV